MTILQRKIIDLSYKHKLSHLSSCLTSVGLIDHIYSIKKENEPFILANGHAGLALYVVLEKYKGIDAEYLIKNHGTHPNRDIESGIYCSTGSLGQGIPIAVGMAMANKKRNVYVLTSDGDMAEGSNWEAMRIAADLRLENLRITCNANGLGAYSRIDVDDLDMRMQMFYPSLVVKTNMFEFPGWIQGIDGHYVVMTKEQYEEITKA